MDPDSTIDTLGKVATFGTKMGEIIQETIRPLNEKRLNKERIRALEEYAQFHAEYPDIEFSSNASGAVISAKAANRSLDDFTSEEIRQCSDTMQVALDDRKQENVAKILEGAASSTSSEEPVSDEDVDQEWVMHFFEGASYVSNESMQAIWSKILAGEIKQPGSFSIRTLDILKKVNKTDAEVFQELCSYVVESTGRVFIGGPSFGDKLLTYEKMTRLKEAGLLAPGDGATLTIKMSEEGETYFIIGDDIVIARPVVKETISMALSIDLLSTSGVELYNLLNTRPSKEFAVRYAKNLAEQYINCETSIHAIVERTGEFEAQYQKSPIGSFCNHVNDAAGAVSNDTGKIEQEDQLSNGN